MTVIAMTREIGSHGSDVAAPVAAQLGLEIINSEIVTPDVAEGLGVEQGVVQRYLDGEASLFDRWQVDTRKLSRPHLIGPQWQDHPCGYDQPREGGKAGTRDQRAEPPTLLRMRRKFGVSRRKLQRLDQQKCTL
jgi:hypothetical protein